MLVALAALAGCSRTGSPPAAQSAEKEAPKLATVRPEKKTIRRTVDQPAQNVEAFQHAPLYSKVAGYVKSLSVDIGDSVKTGNLLAELHIPELDIAVRQCQASLLQSEAEVELAQSSLKAAEASLKSADAMVKQAESGRARARADQARTASQHDRLGKVGGVLNPETMSESRYAVEASKANVEEVEAKVLAAKASRDESAAKRDKARADVEVMEARREVAEASRDHARAMADYRRIVAPFDGVVTRRNVDVGHFVQPAGSGGKAEPLFTVERVDKMRVWVLVPELEAMWVNRELRGASPPDVRVHGDALGGRLLKGTLARSAFALDPRTRSLRAEIDLDNPEGLLRPGMYVYASVSLERKDVWSLPLSAVRRDAGVVTCFVVESGKPTATRLRVGLEGGGLIEVIGREVEGKVVEFTGSEEVVANPPAGMK